MDTSVYVHVLAKQTLQSVCLFLEFPCKIVRRESRVIAIDSQQVEENMYNCLYSDHMENKLQARLWSCMRLVMMSLFTICMELLLRVAI